MIGIPYADHVWDEENGVMYEVCPVCQEGFALTERKDFESFTGNDYANHYEHEHEGARV